MDREGMDSQIRFFFAEKMWSFRIYFLRKVQIFRRNIQEKQWVFFAACILHYYLFARLLPANSTKYFSLSSREASRTGRRSTGPASAFYHLGFLWRIEPGRIVVVARAARPSSSSLRGHRARFRRCAEAAPAPPLFVATVTLFFCWLLNECILIADPDGPPLLSSSAQLPASQTTDSPTQLTTDI